MRRVQSAFVFASCLGAVLVGLVGSEVGQSYSSVGAPVRPDVSRQFALRTDEVDDRRDWVFFTEDIGFRLLGCDAISVFEFGSRKPVHVGEFRPSPSRLTATSDLSLIVASAANSGFMSTLHRDSSADSGWNDTELRGDYLPTHIGGISIAGGDKYLLSATQHHYEECPRRAEDPYFFVSKYLVSELDLEAGEIGPERGRIVLRGPAAEIITADSGRTAHIVSVPYLEGSGLLAAPEVITIDVESMIEIAPRIELERIGSAQTSCAMPFRPVGVTHATISPDERFLVTNRWDESAINVVDLVSRLSWSVDIDGRHGAWTGGVSFSHGVLNHGLLAVHGVDRVSIFEFGEGTDLKEIVHVRVEPAVELREGSLFGSSGSAGGPAAPIEWTWSGQEVLAAVSNRGRVEFRAWTVNSVDSTMSVHSEYEVCGFSEMNTQNGILTGNGVLPTLTPTPTVSSTPTETPSSMLTAPPSATTIPTTLTPTPTATTALLPLFLPIALIEQCDPTIVRADVALILDTSSSMTGEKMTSAKSAAKAFVSAMDLPEDRVGIATFSREAQVVHSLSGDSASLFATIDALEPGAGTRIDRGLEAGLDILADARPDSAVTPLLILLTDGLQEAEPSAPRSVSDRVRSAGITMHVVGLGDDVDEAFLGSLVETAQLLHLSPGTDELEAIYTDIALTIPCPTESYWGRR